MRISQIELFTSYSAVKIVFAQLLTAKWLAFESDFTLKKGTCTSLKQNYCILVASPFYKGLFLTASLYAKLPY